LLHKKYETNILSLQVLRNIASRVIKRCGLNLAIVVIGEDDDYEEEDKDYEEGKIVISRFNGHLTIFSKYSYNR
jgi:hypothetical protein